MGAKPTQAMLGQVDGVPCYWIEDDGLLTAGLTFNVGMADETFPDRGHSHLIEHLALHSAHKELAHNGATSLTSTSFYAQGTVPEIATFFNGVVAALQQLPYHELERECRVLRAEADRRGGSVSHDAFSMLYGSRSAGALAVPEVAHWQPNPQKIDAWKARYFTRQNAVAYFHGPRPDGMSFAGLPDGHKHQRVAPERILGRGQRFTYLECGGPGLYMDYNRAVGGPLVLGIATERLTEVLREERGITYSVAADALNLDADKSVVIIGADSSPENSGEVFEIMRFELMKLANEGPTREEVETFLRRFEKAMAHHEPGLDELTGRATCHLEGRPYMEPIDGVAQVRAMSPEQLVIPLKQALRDPLWVLPHSVHIEDRRLQAAAEWPEAVATGQPRPSKFEDRNLRVDETSISVCGKDPVRWTIMLDQIDGVITYVDGGVAFCQRDGVVLGIKPSDYAAEAEVAQFVARIDPNLIVASDLEYRTEAQEAHLAAQAEQSSSSLRDKFRLRRAA